MASEAQEAFSRLIQNEVLFKVPVPGLLSQGIFPNLSMEFSTTEVQLQTRVCLSSPSEHGATRERNHLAASPSKKMLSQGFLGPDSCGPRAGSCGGALELPGAVQCDTNQGVGDVYGDPDSQ